MLGAGSSVSSGAPTTADVHAALEAATRGRADGDSLREFLHEIRETERQRILGPLFEGIAPHFGYRLLAALGREKHCAVLNLNWDPLLQMACDAAGVNCVSFDLAYPRDRQKIGTLPPGPGVVCAHAHGRLGESCRYSFVETRAFNTPERRFIKKHFWDHLLVICGTSLRGDTDVAALLAEFATKPRAQGLWPFSRDGLDSAEGARRAFAERTTSVRIRVNSRGINLSISTDSWSCFLRNGAGDAGMRQSQIRARNCLRSTNWSMSVPRYCVADWAAIPWHSSAGLV